MNLIKSTCALIVAITSISSNIEAAAVNASNETANISIKQIIMPQTVNSGFVSCHNTLANCLVTLTFINPNQGSVTILNSSAVVAHEVRAILPADWVGKVLPMTTCNVIEAGRDCTLIFQPSSTTTQLTRQTIPIQGRDTTRVYFDMEVIP